MPKIDLAAAPVRIGIDSYPEPFRSRVGAVTRVQLSRAGGLTTLGVNLTTLAPGQMTAMRHWHEREDELVYVLSGTVTLVEDTGEAELGPGDAAGWKAGVATGHHLVNRSDAPAVVVEIGPRHPEERAHYTDADLMLTRTGGVSRFTRRDGTEV